MSFPSVTETASRSDGYLARTRVIQIGFYPRRRYTVTAIEAACNARRSIVNLTFELRIMLFREVRME